MRDDDFTRTEADAGRFERAQAHEEPLDPSDAVHDSHQPDRVRGYDEIANDLAQAMGVSTLTVTNPAEARRLEATGYWVAEAHSDEDREITLYRKDA